VNAVCDSFGRAAASYEAFAPVQTAMADWLAEWMPADRRGSALEVGAGTGLFTVRAQPWTGPYVASDASAGMVALGRAQVPGVEWRELSAAGVGPGGWDWILSASMLQWAEDPLALLRAWREALVPGGRVLAGFYVADTLPELRELFATGREPLAWRGASAWRESFAAAGFEVLRDEAEARVFSYASARALLRSLHATGAAPHRLVAPSTLLAWLRARGDVPFRATWTFYRVEMEMPKSVLRPGLISVN
jgi:malonyl-CoA O-methyltransferase